MTTFTVLQMTQNILSRIGSDAVNSISDSDDSLAVANIIQQKYYDITSRGDLPEHTQMFQLTPSSSTTTPVLMYVPAHAVKIHWMKYFDTSVGDSQQVDQFGAFQHGLNVDIVSSQSWTTVSSTTNTIGLGNKTFTVASSTLPITVGQGVLAVSGTNNMFGNVVSYVGTTLTINVVSISGTGTFSNWVIFNSNNNAVAGYKYIKILSIESFFDMVNKFDPAENNVQSYTFTDNSNNFNLYYKTNRQPQNCCIISNYYVLFDSFDNTQDNALQASKTLVYGQIVPPFSMSDNFIPDIDDQDFALLINEATSAAFIELKQQPNPKVEQETKRQWSAVMRNKAVVNKPTPFEEFPNFGRVNYGNIFTSQYGTRWTRGV